MAEFNSQEAAWSDIRVELFGSRIKGIRAVKYKTSTDKEHLHAEGDEPIGIQSGNVTYSGNLKLLKGSYDQINSAARTAGYRDITAVPPQLVVMRVQYKSGFGRPSQTKVISGIGFQDLEEGLEQAAKFMEIDIPFLALAIEQI